MAYDSPAGLIAMSVVLELLVIGAVVLRFLSRRKMQAGYWMDDWLIVAALVCATGLTINEIYGAAMKALGVPLNTSLRDPQANAARLVAMKRVQFAFWLIGDFGILFTRLSIIFLFRRIFGRNRVFKIISTGWIVFTILWGTAFIMAMLLECGVHIKFAIDGPSTAFRQYCKSSAASGKGMVISDAITDFITLLLPLPWVARLKTSLQRKLSLTAIFMIGAFSVAASITKAVIYITGTTGVYKIDGSILITELSVWNYVEVTVGILAGCAITAGPLFAGSKFPKLGSGLLIRPFRSLRSSIASSSTVHKEKARGSRNSSTTDSLGVPVARKVNAAVSTHDTSVSDLESGDLGPADVAVSEVVIDGRRHDDIDNVDVGRPFPVHLRDGLRNHPRVDPELDVSRHDTPFHYGSTVSP